jgi:hypothetical protein
MAEQKVLNSLELTSMILQWLKDITLEKEGIVFEDDQQPQIPKTWTDRFSRLATVNQAFFQASTDVLPADEDKHGVPSCPLVRPSDYY